MSYQFISFDLWNTLIHGRDSGNGDARAKYFHDKYNPNGLPKSYIRLMLKSVDADLNRTAETTGLGINSRLYIYNALLRLGVNIDRVDHLLIETIHYDLYDLSLDNPPCLFDENTRAVLSLLSNQYELVLHCNTGFAGGDVVVDILNLLDIKQYFYHLHFSDNAGFAKPNEKFLHPKFTNKDGIHIGDSLSADKPFAENTNLDYLIINNPAAAEIEGVVTVPSIQHVSKFLIAKRF